LAAVGAPAPERVKANDGPLGMKFVFLPKGTFYMGWQGAMRGKDREMIAEIKGIKAEIKEGFEIGVHTVTQGQWQAVMGSNPSSFSRNGEEKDKVADIKDEELKLFPVESVSWDDAQAFIKKLNEIERGRGWLYRLPTEAEWEYACRGGATSKEECSHYFYFDKPTNDITSEQANINGNYRFGNAPRGKFLSRPTKVGSYPPNKLGLYDMHGNVWQWCADSWDPGRAKRGGCWAEGGIGCRAGLRYRAMQADQSSHNGFRLVRVRSEGN